AVARSLATNKFAEAGILIVRLVEARKLMAGSYEWPHDRPVTKVGDGENHAFVGRHRSLIDFRVDHLDVGEDLFCRPRPDGAGFHKPGSCLAKGLPDTGFTLFLCQRGIADVHVDTGDVYPLLAEF